MLKDREESHVDHKTPGPVRPSVGLSLSSPCRQSPPSIVTSQIIVNLRKVLHYEYECHFCTFSINRWKFLPPTLSNFLSLFLFLFLSLSLFISSSISPLLAGHHVRENRAAAVWCSLTRKPTTVDTLKNHCLVIWSTTKTSAIRPGLKILYIYTPNQKWNSMRILNTSQ